jgi:predicted RNA-binding protein (virulence factor B family)
MIELGKLQKLRILRETRSGLFLGENEGDDGVLLPGKWIPRTFELGETIEVFIYSDSENRMIATTLPAKIHLHEVAALRVTSVTKFGAFLDWGMDKDLLAPLSEQIDPMRVGERHLVYLYLDEYTNRLVATPRLHKHLKEVPSFNPGDQVDLIIGRKSKLGVQVLINQKYLGLLYHDEIFRELNVGDATIGYIKSVRSDGKVDVSLQRFGYRQVEEAHTVILKKLQAQGGKLCLSDSSSPEEIKEALQMSKSVFKKALGHLYKLKQIKIEKDHVFLL